MQANNNYTATTAKLVANTLTGLNSIPQNDEVREQLAIYSPALSVVEKYFEAYYNDYVGAVLFFCYYLNIHPHQLHTIQLIVGQRAGLLYVSERVGFAPSVKTIPLDCVPYVQFLIEKLQNEPPSADYHIDGIIEDLEKEIDKVFRVKYYDNREIFFALGALRTLINIGGSVIFTAAACGFNTLSALSNYLTIAHYVKNNKKQTLYIWED